MPPTVEKPKDTFVHTKAGGARLAWHTKFKPAWDGKYGRAQKFLDSEILRLSEPFTPLRVGMLIKSGILGTHIGSGLVQWVAIYARRNYYRAKPPGTETGPLRGPFWFERMKKVYGKTLVKGAKNMMGD